MKDVMLDLETLSLSPRAVVVSIGAVYFDPDSGVLGDQILLSCADLAAQQRAGRIIDADTVLWWLDQSKGAQLSTFGQVDERVERYHTLQALDRFTEFLGHYGPGAKCLWGNGSAFDVTILESLYISFGKKVPWSSIDVRCYRTLKNLRPEVRGEGFGTKHNALDDAIAQAQHAQQLLFSIKHSPGFPSNLVAKSTRKLIETLEASNKADKENREITRV